MNLALFDLDNTLIAGDSDFQWAQFLIEKKHSIVNCMKQKILSFTSNTKTVP